MIGVHVIPGHAWIITNFRSRVTWPKQQLPCFSICGPQYVSSVSGRVPSLLTHPGLRVTLTVYFTQEMQIPNRMKLGFLPSPLSPPMFISCSLKIWSQAEMMGSPQLPRLTALCRNDLSMLWFLDSNHKKLKFHLITLSYTFPSEFMH